MSKFSNTTHTNINTYKWCVRGFVCCVCVCVCLLACVNKAVIDLCNVCIECNSKINSKAVFKVIIIPIDKLYTIKSNNRMMALRQCKYLTRKKWQSSLRGCEWSMRKKIFMEALNFSLDLMIGKKIFCSFLENKSMRIGSTSMGSVKIIHKNIFIIPQYFHWFKVIFRYISRLKKLPPEMQWTPK